MTTYTGFAKPVNVNVNLRQLAELALNSSKGFICPGCNCNYDINLRNYVFTGKVPLILNCKHTLCEDCIRQKLKTNKAVCPQCEEQFTSESDKALQELYPVNFYLLGLIYYAKPAGTDGKVGLQLSGFRRPEKYFHSASFVDTSLSSSSAAATETCAAKDCKEPAQVHCTDCAEVYCNTCSDIIHKMARGFRSHKISPVAYGAIKQIRDPCEEHPNGILEFHCDDCDKDICAYCLIKNHHGHKFDHLANMNESELAEFSALLSDVESVLKRLELTQKTVQWQLDQNRPTHNKLSKTEIDLCRYFADLHGKLQLLETRLREEATVARNHSYWRLSSFSLQLYMSIRHISSLVDVGKPLLSGGANHQKIDVRALKDKLRKALLTPCYLIGNKQQELSEISFTTTSVLDEIDKHLVLQTNVENGFRLVSKDELPENYREFQVPEDFKHHSPLSSRSVSVEGSVVGSDICSAVYGDTPSKASSITSEHSRKSVVHVNPNSNWPVTAADLIGQEKFKAMGQKGEHVYVSHLNTPTSFFVQLVINKQRLSKLTEDLDTYCKELALPAINPTCGNLYIVKGKGAIFTSLRARITDVITDEKNKETTYKVLFIDYGYTKTVKKHELRELSDELAALPPFAIHCKVYDLQPRKHTWDSKAVTLMTQIINDVDVIMHVINNSPEALDVDLITFPTSGEGTSLREFLIFTGHGCPISGDFHNFAAEINPVYDQTTLFDNRMEFEESKTYKVILSHVVDPDNIFVQLAGNFGHITKLVEEMNRMYEGKNKYFVYNPRKDMCVAAKFSQINSPINSWYRARVLNVLEGKGTIELFLVDYGQTEILSWTLIRRLLPQFKALECQAINVRLADIAPIDPKEGWAEQATALLEKFIISQDRLKMIVKDPKSLPPTVALFEVHPTADMCINAQIVANNFGVSTGKISKTVKWEQEQKQEVEESYTATLIKLIQTRRVENEALNCDNDDETIKVLKKRVHVHKSVSPSEIYVTFDDERIEKVLQEMDSALQECYSRNNIDNCKPKVDLRCVVRVPKDQKYFRAQIKSVDDNKACRVLLTDTLEEVDVELKYIYPMNEHFQKYPSTLVKCSLSGIIPAGGSKKWSHMAIEFLEDLFKNHDKLYITRNGPINEDHSLSVTMWYTEFITAGPLEPSTTKYHSVSKLLIENGLALKKRPQLEQAKNDDTVVQGASSSNDVELSKAKQETVTNPEPAEKLMQSILKCTTDTAPKQVKSPMSHRLKKYKMKTGEASTSDVPKFILPPVGTDYLPAEPLKKTTFTGVVTYVDMDSTIYVQNLKLDPAFKEMVTLMKAFFDSLQPDPPDTVYNNGELCTALYHENKCWYRGKVVGRESPNSYKVLMIDYGNEEICLVSEMRKTALFTTIPSFTHKFRLHNVYAKNKMWISSDLDRLHHILADKKIVVVLKGKQQPGLPTYADMYTEDNIYINDYIVKNSVILSRTPWKTPVVVPDDDDDIIECEVENPTGETVCSQEDVPPTVSTYKYAKLPGVNETVEVAIINFIEFNVAILEIIGESLNTDIFVQISSEMQTFGLQQPVLLPEQIRPGQPCVCQFSEDEKWYRAEIYKILEPGHVRILYVDFGNLEDVDISFLRQMRPEWLAYPLQHYRASVDNVEVVDETKMDEIFQFLDEYAGTIQKATIFCLEPLQVVLLEKDTGLTLYSGLLNSGLVKIKNEYLVF